MRATPRHRLALAAGIVTLSLALAACGEDGAAGQGSSTQTIKVYSLTLRGDEQPIHVVAKGLISGIGTVATDRETGGRRAHQVTLRFDRGTVRLALRLTPEGEGWRRPTRRTCTAKRFGRGTFRIAGGTGAYEGANGKGKFSESGIAIAQRTRSGECLGERTPLANVIFYVKMRMTGDATLPAS
jgi:hypothetical protein